MYIMSKDNSDIESKPLAVNRSDFAPLDNIV